MVGFKSFWILIFTLLLGACVPQTKQSQCASNEAFNPALRTCVPVVGGSTSLLQISSYSPLYSQSRSKSDPTLLTFSIVVANPYGEAYTIEWERVFNAAPISMCGNTPSCSFSAALLGTTLGEVGTHILTAKVKDSNGSVAATKNFELRVSELPKPVINTATLIPSTYAFDKIPTDPRVEFSFTIRNNNAVLNSGDQYRTTWTVQKNGSTIYTETDLFTVFTLTGNNLTQLGTAVTPYFNPATLGVGNYVVRATVQNTTPGEVIEERQWNINIKQPDLTRITGITEPSPGVVVTSHNNVDYDDYVTPVLRSWKYSSPAIQPNFCVDIEDRDGTYAGDGKSIQVRWYLDSVGTEICTKKTVDTNGSQKLCLIDATPCEGQVDPDAVKDAIKFTNSNPLIAQNHKITARIIDEATATEIDRGDIVPSNGSYPIEWLVNVMPVNTAPVLSFGTTNPTGCAAGGVYILSGCRVNQGTNFTVSFSTTDDHYLPTTDAAQFQWNMALKLNGTDFVGSPTNTACSKALGTATTVPAASGPYTTQWTCTMAVPHYNSLGPLNPSVGSFQAVVTLADSGSPVGGTPLTSNTLTWNFVVTETNPSGVVQAAQTNMNSSSNVTKGVVVLDPADPTSFATELESVTFRTHVTDAEIDDFKYRVSLCTDNTPACTQTFVISSPSYLDFLRSIQTVPTVNPVLISALTYTIPEDFLIARHSSSIDINLTTNRLVYFKVDVIDIPSVPTTPQVTSSQIYSFNVRNYNPAPVINTAGAVPAVGSTSIVYSGFPFTIDPGTVTDPSVHPLERNISYQWYAKIGAGAWTAIPNATTRLLTYTPGNISSNIDLKLCVGDGTVANPVSSTGTCSANWIITPKPYLYNLSATGSANVSSEVAIWHDEANANAVNTQVIYSAYVDSNNDILVEKTVKDASGNFILSTSTIKFEALPSLVANVVSNISITTSTDSIYVSYLASANSGPSGFYPRVRRIDKDFDATKRKSGLSDPAPFGFNYGNLVVTCSNSAVCSPAPVASDGIGGPIVINIAQKFAVGETITINNEVFTAATASPGMNDICGGAGCTTTTDTATNLRDKINASTAANLHGIVATASGSVVNLYSSYSNDYLDFDGSNATDMVAKANGLGKIFIQGGRWYLPMINSSLGVQQDNVTLISGLVDVHLNNSGSLGLDTGDVLTDMGKVALFDSKVTPEGILVFAKISGDTSDAGTLTLYRYQYTAGNWVLLNTGATPNPTDRNFQDIMGSYSFQSVKLAVNNTSNPYFYILAQEKTVDGSEWHMGRYNYELDSGAPALEYFVTAKLNTADSTPTFITDVKLKNPEIVAIPGYAEARIFFQSVGAGATYYPRMARWKQNDTVQCGTCFSLSGTLANQATSKIAVSQLVADQTFGVAGAQANQNIRDIVYTLFGSDITATSAFRPQLGVINVETETIQSTTSDSTGLFRPAFSID